MRKLLVIGVMGLILGGCDLSITSEAPDRLRTPSSEAAIEYRLYEITEQLKIQNAILDTIYREYMGL